MPYGVSTFGKRQDEFVKEENLWESTKIELDLGSNQIKLEILTQVNLAFHIVVVPCSCIHTPLTRGFSLRVPHRHNRPSQSPSPIVESPLICRQRFQRMILHCCKANDGNMNKPLQAFSEEKNTELL